MARLLLATALAAATLTSVAAWGALPPALGDGFDQFAARMLRHGVHLTVEASYQDPPSGLRIYVTLFTQDGK